MFRPLLLVSHPRSASHFLMSAIKNNSSNFFDIQKPFFALDNLFLPISKTRSEEFVNWYNELKKKNKIPIIGMNCLMEDLKKYIEKKKQNSKEVLIIKEIINKGIYINLIRDPRDCLLSWYKLAKSGGAIAFAASKFRLADMSFEDFLKAPNIHKLMYRNYEIFDNTTLSFCAYHHYSWKKFSENKGHLVIKFQDLKNNFQLTLKQVFKFLSTKYRINFDKKIEYMIPPNSYSARYYRKLGKLLNNFDNILYSRLLILLIKKIFNYDLELLKSKIDSAFLASSVPEGYKNYKPSKSLNNNLMKQYNLIYKKYSRNKIFKLT